MVSKAHPDGKELMDAYEKGFENELPPGIQAYIGEQSEKNIVHSHRWYGGLLVCSTSTKIFFY